MLPLLTGISMQHEASSCMESRIASALKVARAARSAQTRAGRDSGVAALVIIRFAWRRPRYASADVRGESKFARSTALVALRAVTPASRPRASTSCAGKSSTSKPARA